MEVQKGEELVEMVGGFLEGLRQRSLYAVAHRDANKQGRSIPQCLFYEVGIYHNAYKLGRNMLQRSTYVGSNTDVCH